MDERYRLRTLTDDGTPIVMVEHIKTLQAVVVVATHDGFRLPQAQRVAAVIVHMLNVDAHREVKDHDLVSHTV